MRWSMSPVSGREKLARVRSQPAPSSIAGEMEPRARRPRRASQAQSQQRTPPKHASFASVNSLGIEAPTRRSRRSPHSTSSRRSRVKLHGLETGGNLLRIQFPEKGCGARYAAARARKGRTPGTPRNAQRCPSSPKPVEDCKALRQFGNRGATRTRSKRKAKRRSPLGGKEVYLQMSRRELGTALQMAVYGAN
jgi:hypothetical protein